MVQAGVDMVAELLGVTLGPKGRNVVLPNRLISKSNSEQINYVG